ncbi:MULTISPECIES: HD domain-containing protein [unclassified Nocardiopsis]|uniref:HD domain-containing protein n=1 Tax=unclassified Nocardiopsis TaxID=2649073 RepID=UPI00066DDF37|nr:MULTISPECIES: HD domain-containing protein [unclassified Nocardiopsis]MBQ1083748.1 HD domain-containing protein [Nocardiopsis sp. B62]
MQIPTDDEIRALHERHAPTAEAFELVYTHCRAVCEVAELLLDHVPAGVDADLVRAGCLLHDVGVYRLMDGHGRIDGPRYVSHGVLGHELLVGEGLPETLCRFCSHHTGVGVTRDDVRAQGLPIPVADYLAESPEEELVMYADKFHSKSQPPVFLTADTYAAKVSRFGPEKEIRFKDLVERYGEPDLAALSHSFGHALV